MEYWFLFSILGGTGLNMADKTRVGQAFFNTTLTEEIGKCLPDLDFSTRFFFTLFYEIQYFQWIIIEIGSSWKYSLMNKA